MSQDSKIFLSPEFLSEFIEKYRETTCLWKVRSSEYMDRNKKDEAWKTLVEFTKERIPGADLPFVKKKIENIRASFRKELKKVRESERSGTSADSCYRPTLWYFEKLSFTIDQEMPRQSQSNLDEGEQLINEENQEDELQEIETIAEDSNKSLEYENVSAQSSRTSTPTPAAKKRKTKNDNDEEVKRALMGKALSTLTSPADAFDILGKSYAEKLRRMETHQRDIADKIINETLFKGLQNQLTINTALYEYSSFPHINWNANNQ